MSEYRKDRKPTKKQKYFKKQKNDSISKKKRLNSIKKLVTTNRLSKALSETESYLSDYPNDSFGLFQHANIIWLLGMTEEAKKEFQYIIDHELESKYSSIYKLGIIAINQEQPDKAYEYFKFNIENSPYDETLSIKELSNLELEKGNYEEAYNVLERYSNMENDQILLQAIYVLYAQEKYAEAYNIIVNHNIYDNSSLEHEYYRIKGIIEIGLKKYEEAEQSLFKSLCDEKNDTYYKIKTEMAHLYFKQGKFKQATDICIEMLNAQDKRYIEKARIILGNVCQATMQYEMAKKQYLESVNYNYYRDIKGYFYAGNICMIQKKYSEAKEYYQKYLQTANTSKNKSKVYLKLALISAKEGNVNQLEKYVKKIEKNNLIEIDLEDYKSLKTHICYMKNIPVNMDFYRVKQLYQYSLEELRKHIDRVHISYDKQEMSIFNDSIDLDELICQIPELLSKAERIDNHYYERYQVTYPNIGYVNGKLTDTLELVVFPESQKVLTMFPVGKSGYQSQNIEAKYKQKSQIDKFNQKYKMKEKM